LVRQQRSFCGVERCELRPADRRTPRQTGAGHAVECHQRQRRYRLASHSGGFTGFSGVFTNFHPELYSWLWHHGKTQRELADELAIFLSLGAVTETLGYPKNAKIYHQRLGTFDDVTCRVNKDDVLTKFWGLTVILDQIRAGTELWQTRLAR
jgi:hypothetical protein